MVPARAGRRSRPKEGEPKTTWESDQLIVLSERESRAQGEGADVDTKPTKETLTRHEGLDDSANLPVGNSAVMRKRVFMKSPVRENRTPGSVRGASGNRRPYRDDCRERLKP